MSNTFRYSRKYDDFLFYHIADVPQKDYIMHSHDICEFLFLKRGNVTYNVEGRLYHLTHNCMILTRPFERHSITFNSPSEYERYVLLFDEKKIGTDTYAQIPPTVDVINFDGNTLVCNLFQKFDYYFTCLEPQELQSVLLHFIPELLYNVRLSAREIVASDMSITNTLVNDAVKYIDANIHVPLNIDDVCNQIHITKGYLHQLFVKYLQIPPGQYIVSKKLAMAQSKLRMGARASDVYLSCGFADYSTFYRDYKKHFGHAPSEEINTAIVREIYE